MATDPIQRDDQTTTPFISDNLRMQTINVAATSSASGQVVSYRLNWAKESLRLGLNFQRKRNMSVVEPKNMVEPGNQGLNTVFSSFTLFHAPHTEPTTSLASLCIHGQYKQ